MMHLTPGFMAHGHCYFWNPYILVMHFIGGLLAFISYVSIPFVIWYVISRRKDLPEKRVAYWFIAFILICGFGHFINILTIKYPVYWLSGVVTLLTGLISAYVAISFFNLRKRFLAAPTPDQVAALEDQLARVERDLEIERKKNRLFLIGNTQFRKGLGLKALDALAENKPQTMQRIVMKTLGNVDKLLTHAGNMGEVRPFNLSAYIIDLCFDHGISTKKVNPDVMVVGAHAEIRAAVYELIKNAVQYNASEKPPRAILDEVGPFVILTIKNRGALPDEYPEIIKAAWFSTSGGQGMGLALVEGCAQAHGGSLDISQHSGTVSAVFKISRGF